MEDRLRARRDPDPLRAHPEPGRGAARPAARAACPRSERANPARETSTSNARRPGFRTVIAAADAPLSVRRSGLALSPMPRPAAAPGMDAAAAPRTSRYECASHLPITVNVSVAV